jgi:adenine-specific DNA-methyltransferase
MSENTHPDRLDMASTDFVKHNIEALAALFPNCVTETADGKAVDFDLLKQELNHQIIEGNKERYRLEWPGKREAIVTANLPTTKTLRPVREDSVDFDNTENLYIEGDNLEVLKLLQESYFGKIKMIYIDPPYNTGKDFVYKDDFAKSSEEELLESGQKNEYNQRLIANPETSGRYHSDWLTMMYPRLKLARNLLAEEGIIFISIDDYEFDNLRKICNEIFGEFNSLTESPTTLIWKKSSSTAGHFSSAHEYVLVYCKNKKSLPFFALNDYGEDSIIEHSALKRISSANPASKITLKKGLRYEGSDNTYTGLIGNSETMEIIGEMIFKEGELQKDVEVIAGWAMKDQILSWLQGKETYDTKGQKVVEFFFNRQGLLRYKKERGTLHPKTILPDDVGSTKAGGNDLENIFNIRGLVSYPKPINYLKYFLSFVTKSNDIILDFFSGSATTADATIRLNAEDGGNRKYIMVQLPEEIDEKSEAYKAGYNNICEVGKERIRRAGKKIKEELTSKNAGELKFSDKVKEGLDIGFRVYRLDESNMQDVYYRPQDYNQEQLEIFADNIKPDRTADDLLTQVMLDWGLPLSYKIDQLSISGKQVFQVAQNSLTACFDKNIDEAFAKEVAVYKPIRIVFRDKGFKNDTAKENVRQLLKQLSPETEMRVI